jgi:serine/threonine protein kinase/tetratricopeptide (TPR) repeat protein
MNAEFQRVKEVFLAALEKDAAGRPAFLAEACGSDADLRRQVDGLLAQHASAGSFLEGPAGDPSPTIDEHASELQGTIIGPYKLLQQIGEGGMGTVFMAEQNHPVQRKVALKIIKPGMDSHQVIARFEAERQALALMDHANIAKVFDAGTTAEGRPYFVMELVRGVPLTRYCDEHHLPPKQRLQLFVPVCQAVQHAHHKGIIHRDLKPSNVLVAEYDDKPVPKVIDFGVAKATGPKLTELTMYTEFGQVVGTLEYMSPEQAKLNALDIDTRSDIYTLGVLLYELLTGTTPFEQKRLKQVAFDEVLRIIREEEPPRPSTRLDTTEQLPAIAANRGLEPKRLSGLVRGELDWIVMRALEKDRNRRYDTASALAADIERYLADEPVHACPPSAWYRLRKAVHRHKSQVAAAVAMLVLVVLGAAASMWQAIRATRAEHRTSEALTRVTAAQAQTREALDALTEDVVETMFMKQNELGEKEHAFLRKVAAFYEAFSEESASSAEALFMRAKGHYTIAYLRGLLGERRDSVAGFRRAEAMLEQLVSEFPEEAVYRNKLARTEGNLAVALAKMGNQADAEPVLLRGIALGTKLVEDFPKDPEYRLDLANKYHDLAYLRELQHQYAEAEENYRRSLDLKKQLSAEAGDAPRYRTPLAQEFFHLGQLMRRQEKYAESEQFCRQAVEIMEKQIGKGPAPPKEIRILADSYSGLGIALAEQKRLREAETTFRDVITVRRKLADDYPRMLDYRRELGNAVEDLAYFLTRQGKDAAAEEPYRQALEIRKGVVAQGGPVPDYRQELARGYHDLGGVLQVIHRPQEAEPALRTALGIWQQLAVDLPQVLDYQKGLGATLTNLANLLNARGEFTAAVPLLDKASVHLQKSLEARPKVHDFREPYRNYLLALAQSRLGLADHVRTASTASELARFGFEPADDTYSAAGLLARCIPLAEMDAALSQAKRKELSQSYAEQALTMLQQAVKLGFKDPEHLKKDPDFKALQANEQYRKLVANLESAKK